MAVAKILYRARPVDIGKQSVVAEAQAFDPLGRVEIEDFFERSLVAHLIQPPQEHDGTGQRKQQQNASRHRNLARASHFRFRRSKISTAPQIAAAEYASA